MKKQRLPEGWTEKRIRALAAHHDQQTEEQQAAEIDAAFSAKRPDPYGRADGTSAGDSGSHCPQMRRVNARQASGAET
jgi:hypothetical protein